MLLLQTRSHLVQALVHADLRELHHLPGRPFVLGDCQLGFAVAQVFEHHGVTLIGGEVGGHTELLGV